HVGDLPRDAVRGGLPELHHRDDARDADDDPEHRQERTHLVAPDRLEGEHERVPDDHASTSRGAPSATIRPSRKTTARGKSRTSSAIGRAHVWTPVTPYTTLCRSGCPRCTIAMTLATPLTTPSIVRNERTLLRQIAWKASTSVFQTIMRAPPAGPRRRRSGRRERPRRAASHGRAR